MAKIDINIGASANDKGGDTLRVAFNKINLNFTELYALTGGTSAALTELAQDYAAPLLNHANHTNITAVYNDANNKILLTGTPAQVQSDWTQATNTALDYIKNKPTIPTSFTSLVNGINSLTLAANAPSTLEGSIGDVPKLIAFDSDRIYYSTGTFSAGEGYTFTSNDTLSGIMVGLLKGIVTPLAGWTITNGIVTRTIVTVYDNTTYWYIELDGSFASTNGGQYTITSIESTNIWKQTPFFPDTYGSNGQVLTTDGSGNVSWVSAGGLSVSDFGEGFSLTDADKIVTNKLYSTNLTQPTQHYRLELDTNGVVVLPDSSIINGSTIRGVAGTGELNYTGITIGPNSNDAEKTWMWVDHENAYISTNNSANTWTFGTDGRTTFPFNMLATDSQLIIQSDGETEIRNLSETNSIDIVTNITNGDTRWSFGIDSTLTLPAPLAQLINTNQLDSDTAKIYRATNSTDAEAIQSAWNTWYGDEWVFRTYVQEDESSRGSNFPWHGMPSWEAYPLIMNWNSQGGPGLPPSSSMAPAAVAAINAYLAYKELVSSIDIVNGNKTISFDNTGLLSLPGKLEFKDTANAKIILKTIDPYGYVVEDSEQDKTWTFNTNGSLTFPDSTVQTTAFTGTATPNNITNTAGAGGSATIVVGGTLMTKNELSIRVTNNTNTLDVEINYSNPDGQRLVSVYRSYPSGANLYSGRTLKAANNTTWDLVGNLPVEGDSLSFTVTDHSFLKVYRVTVVADVMPGVTAAGEVFCIIEALK